MKLTGKMSTFGGPHDTGVAPDEGLSILTSSDTDDPKFSGLFLPQQPPGTSGVARRLNPDAFYLACRWIFSETPRSILRSQKARLSANGKSILATPADWGPNVRTGRIADLSPGAAKELGLQTDDTVTVEFPAPSDTSAPEAQSSQSNLPTLDEMKRVVQLKLGVEVDGQDGPITWNAITERLGDIDRSNAGLVSFWQSLSEKLNDTTKPNSGDGIASLWAGRRGADAIVKVIAIRGALDKSAENRLGIYDDVFVLFQGEKITTWKGSTDPGQYFIDNPENPKGCAQLQAGAWMFTPGIHRGQWMAYIQAEDFKVNRLNQDGSIHTTDTGDFGIHLHSGGPGVNVDHFSAGCQVIWSPEGYFGATWHRFYDPSVASLHAANQKNLPYLLIEASEIPENILSDITKNV